MNSLFEIISGIVFFVFFLNIFVYNELFILTDKQPAKSSDVGANMFWRWRFFYDLYFCKAGFILCKRSCSVVTSHSQTRLAGFLADQTYVIEC